MAGRRREADAARRFMLRTGATAPRPGDDAIRPRHRPATAAERAMVAAAVVAPSLMSAIPSLGNFLVLPLMEEFGASRPTVLFCIELGAVATLLAGPAVGFLLTRVQAWILMVLGAVVAGLGLLAVGAAPAFWLVATGYFAAQGLGAALCGVLPAQSVVIRRFPERIGIVAGAQTVATAVTTIIVSLAVAPLLVTHGWRAASVGVALVLIVLPAVLAAAFLRGRRPAGRDAGGGADGAAASPRAAPEAAPTTARIFRSPAFWLLGLTMFPIAVLASAVNHNLIPFYTETGRSVEQAGALLAVIGAASALGALLIGSAADRLRPALVIAAIAATAVAAMLALSLGFRWPAIPLAIMFFGLAGLLAVLSVAVRHYFGTAAFAPVSGLLAPFLLLSPFGGTAAGWLREQLGSYAAVFGVLAGLMAVSLLAALALLLVKPRTA